MIIITIQACKYGAYESQFTIQDAEVIKMKTTI